MSAARAERVGFLAGYTWMHVVGMAYCVAVAWWSASAYLAEGLSGRALVCVGAQALGIVLIVLARRAIASEAPYFGVFLLAPAVACCAVAALGIQHAWNLQGGHLPYAMALFVAAVELIVFLGVDHIASREEEARAKRAVAATERQHEADVSRQRDLLRLAKEYGDTPLRVVAGTSVLAGGQALATPAEAAMQAPASAQRAPMASTYTGYERPHDHVRALYEAGERSPTAIHKQVKALSRQRISAMLNQWQREADRRAG